MKAPLSIILASSILFADELRSIIDNTQNIFYLHNQTLNQRLGSLTSHYFDQSIWTRVGFTQQSTKPSSILLRTQMQSLMMQIGYDHDLKSKLGQNFLGFYADYSHSWLDTGFKGDANTLALTLYNTFLHRSHFYVDTSLKYLYSMQKIHQFGFGAHLFTVSLELGYKIPLTQVVFLQPLLKASAGYSPSFLKTKDQYPLFIKAGSYLGFDFSGNIQGDVRLGAFFDSDLFFEENASIFRENYRLNFALESNLHITKDFRIYLGTQTSFFGKNNIDYAIHGGFRFLIGREYQRPRAPIQSQRNIKDIQREMLYQAELSRQRVQERTHLKEKELQEKIDTQNKRNSPYVQEDLKYTSRQRMIRESARWIDTYRNQFGYQNRNSTSLRSKDIENIKAYNQRELERKYGQ